MPWVTINGNHVLIGESEATAAKARKLSARAQQVHAAAAAVKQLPPQRTHPEKVQDRGHTMGYRDVSNFVNGPKHTRHAIHERLRKLNTGDAIESPFWQGYARGARAATNDWMNHISRTTGGKMTRTAQRLRALEARI